MRYSFHLAFLVLLAACDGEAVEADASGPADAGTRSDGGDAGTVARDAGPPLGEGWPAQNEHSWNGRWSPSPGELPPVGLFDDEYFDGHLGRDGAPTPVLPPGAWDWSDVDDDLANWRNFESTLGRFEALTDSGGGQFGWRLVGGASDIDYAGPAAYFEGSSGADWLDLGPNGAIHSFDAGNLAGGPDVLVFDRSYSLDFRTGTSGGTTPDDDLVIAGCTPTTGGAFDILTTTLHTGPGVDWVFIRDVSRAAVDLGNGAGGRTDTADPDDGNDLCVLRGNTHDFRVYGGRGDDVVFWFVDDNEQTTTWLGPNFFGGGGAGDALFSDPGTDRLVLVVPDDTEVLGAVETPMGAITARGADGSVVLDDPTQGDPFAAYCVECGEGPGGRRTLILEYRSADGSVHTGYFYVTAFEELQVGLGDAARLFRIDDAIGALVPDASLVALTPPVPPSRFCE